MTARALIIALIIAAPAGARAAEIEPAGAGYCLFPGVCEYRVTPGKDSTYHLPVAGVVTLRLPTELADIRFSALGAARPRRSPWHIDAPPGARSVVVRPGHKPVDGVLTLVTKHFRVSFRLSAARGDAAAGAVQYGLVTEEPVLRTYRHADALEAAIATERRHSETIAAELSAELATERQRADDLADAIANRAAHAWRNGAAAAAAAQPLTVHVRRSTGPLEIAHVSAMWARDDLLLSLWLDNRSTAPISPSRWDIRAADGHRYSVIPGGLPPRISPGEAARLALVVTDAAGSGSLPALRVTAWHGSEIVAQADTSEPQLSPATRRALREFERENENRTLDYDADGRSHLAVFGVLGAARLPSGTELAQGAGLRYALGLNRFFAWEFDLVAIGAGRAAVGRLHVGGRVQIGYEGWNPVIHLSGGAFGGRMADRLDAGMSGSLGFAVERELTQTWVVSVGSQVTAGVTPMVNLILFEAGAQLGARWK